MKDKKRREPKSVYGGTITSIAGGRSGALAGVRVSREDRKNSVMVSPTSQVGKSRFERQ